MLNSGHIPYVSLKQKVTTDFCFKFKFNKQQSLSALSFLSERSRAITRSNGKGRLKETQAMERI